VLAGLPDAQVCDSVDGCVAAACQRARAGDIIVVMSNGGFGGIHQRLLDRLAGTAP
jgi:UDP-N-acetylmuramate: L-alanyl-gamma-D-glutamyl-meso-diaminopimelate ligase